jgi:Transport and Golgi organisation 2
MVANCFAPVHAMAVKQNWQIIPRVDSNAEVCSRQCCGGFMCTLTVVTNNETYLIAMNRDEKIKRSAGFPLDIYEVGSARVIYPCDESGGTWLAVNEYGTTLALLNWNDVAASGILAKTRSRGQVIPALIGSRSLSDLHDVIHLSNFEGMLPFRLVGVFPFEQQIWEWRWDAKQVDSQLHLWQSRHWFSSSLSDERAKSLRGAACRRAQNASDAGSVPWLRRLHASHATGPGPFSLCVHRDDVKTLSFSEVSVTGKLIDMHHFRGSPCYMVATDTKGMDRNCNPDSIDLRVSEAQRFLTSWMSTPDQNNQPTRYDERPAYIDRSRRKSVEEDEIGDLKYNEQRGDVQPGNVSELNRGQVKRCAIEGKEHSTGEKEGDPR